MTNLSYFSTCYLSPIGTHWQSYGAISCRLLDTYGHDEWFLLRLIWYFQLRYILVKLQRVSTRAPLALPTLPTLPSQPIAKTLRLKLHMNETLSQPTTRSPPRPPHSPAHRSRLVSSETFHSGLATSVHRNQHQPSRPRHHLRDPPNSGACARRPPTESDPPSNLLSSCA